MLLCECVEPTSDFSCPVAVATQSGRSDFTAGMVTEVAPVHAKDTVIVHVDHLVDHGVFHMFFAEETVLAE